MWTCTTCEAPINSLEEGEQHYAAEHPEEWAKIQEDFPE